MNIDDAMLMAFADGELDGEERAAVARALEQDPVLRARVEQHCAMRARLSGAYAGLLDEPVPGRLQAAAKAPATAGIVGLNARRAPHRWSMREWSAMAASLAGGVVIGLGIMNTQAPPIAVTDGGMSARGALKRALDVQLASEQAGAVRIGLSFRTANGGYCRTFELTERQTAGLACRRAQGWDVTMTTARANQGEVRTAAAPEDVLAAVARIIDGEPMDAEAEARARDAGWR